MTGAAAAISASVALAAGFSGGAAAEVTNIFVLDGGTRLVVEGEDFASNHITIREKTNPNTGPFYEIHDPGGVLVVPPGCSREDANTIRCPTAGITSIRLVGGLRDDTLTLDITSAIDTDIDGFGGDDIISGGPGEDVQNGGPGNDEMFGKQGNDKQIGGAGNDHQSGQAGNDKQLGGPGDDTLKGGPGKDTQNCGGGKNDKGVGGAGKDKRKGCEKGTP